MFAMSVNPLIDHHCCYECVNSLNDFFCYQCTYEFCGNGAHVGYNCPAQVPSFQTLPSFPQQYPCCEDCEDDDDDYNSVITPNEPVDSLSIGDEHLNTIPATESDELIKSYVENLVPNPSESEGKNGYDVPACFTTFSNVLFDAEYEFDSFDDQSCSDEDVPKKIFSNPLFDKEIISMKIDPHHFIAESDLIESLLNSDSSIIYSSLKIDSLLDEFAEFVSKNSNAKIEYFSPSPIPVEDSDSRKEEIDLSFNPDDPMPPRIEEYDYDPERDILILEELLDNYSLSLPVNESFYFDIPSFSYPPGKPPDGNTRILNIKMMGDNSEQKKLPVCYNDDDDEERSNSLKDNINSELPPCAAITPNEPVDSLSMGDEHLNTILAMESNKFIKSSVENLVPNPSEYEGENKCDAPACFTTFSNILFDAEYDFYSVDDQSFFDEDLPKGIYSNPLFNEEIIPIKIAPHPFNALSYLLESILNHDSSIIISSKIDSLLDEFAGELTLLKSIPTRINETDCYPEKETHFTKRLLYDNSSPCPPEEFVSDNSDADIESFSPSPIPIKDSDSLMEEIDLYFTPDDPMPPGIEEDNYDSEKDIPILEELLENYSLSLPDNESFYFDIPSLSRPPAKPPDGNTVILNIKMMGDISKQKVPIHGLTITRVSNQEKSPDLLSHQGLEIFQLSAKFTPTEPVDSLSMGDEHLNTIPATKSDEFIKSCVENLVPNPSESEDENKCDVPAGFTTFSNVLFDDDYDSDSSDDQSLSVEDVREKIYSNPLFDEEIIPMEIDQHSFNARSDLIGSMPNHDSSIIISLKIDSLFDEFAGELTLLKSFPPGIDATDCHPEKEIRLAKRLLYDNSSPRPPDEIVSDNSNVDIESFSPFPILNEDSASHMEEIDLYFNPDDPMPSGIEDDDYDSERDIPILEELLENYSLSLPTNESYHFDIPSPYRPPAKHQMVKEKQEKDKNRNKTGRIKKEKEAWKSPAMSKVQLQSKKQKKRRKYRLKGPKMKILEDVFNSRIHKAWNSNLSKITLKRPKLPKCGSTKEQGLVVQ
nr:hypothetical protein [Tanacetum cinerariifolium]